MRLQRIAAKLVASGMLAILVALMATGCAKSSPVAPTPPVTPPTLPPLSEMLAEKTLGSATAPVTLIEYSSLACPYCAAFHSVTLPQIKTTYIDTGRVKLVFRDFPLLQLEGEAPMAAAMVARCSGSGYFAAIDTLFRNQASWAYAGNYAAAIKNVVSGIGITSDYVDACLATPGLRDGILAIENAGIQPPYQVTGTPTFFVNGQKVVGAQPFSVFQAIIDSF